jgi:adenosylmethionine-8-amino-7-oxononanoate aminotransferase
MKPEDIDALVSFDQQHLWHPYATMDKPPPAYPVVAADGVMLRLADGRQLIDGMSSWWSAIHGYNNPVLNRAAVDQLGKMSHVMFGGITHPPAVALGRQLLEICPSGLSRIFYSDSGSVAVEVAIKLAYQYWLGQGQRQRSQLLTVRNGYHGDTFGAMSVCDPVNGMHHLFQPVMQQHLFAEAPACAFDQVLEEHHVADVTRLLEQHSDSIAALIIEPIVQGAGGMRFYAPEYLRRLRQLCDDYGILLIADEIATGFGRSGKLFACEHAAISPDILCLGKAITGGYLSFAATLCTDNVADKVCSGEAGALMHGPTFMANPLACAIAGASIDLLLSQDWQANILRIEALLEQHLAPARDLATVRDVRVLGAIGVIEMKQPVDIVNIQRRLVASGIWVRPFGKLVYIMPPYVISNEELVTLASSLVKVVASEAEHH